MNNKLPLFATLLVAALIVGFFYFNEQNTTIKNTKDNSNFVIKNAKDNSKKLETNDADNEKLLANYKLLDDLNKQLTDAMAKIKQLEYQAIVSATKPSILSSEIKRNAQAQLKIKNLEEANQALIAASKKATPKITFSSPTTPEKTVQITTEDKAKMQQLGSIVAAFKQQHQQLIKRDIERIKNLKESSSGIAITGIIVPVVGIATLISYTLEEINNYCQDIKNTINLEQTLFDGTISLDKESMRYYKNQCL